MLLVKKDHQSKAKWDTYQTRPHVGYKSIKSLRSWLCVTNLQYHTMQPQYIVVWYAVCKIHKTDYMVFNY